MGWDGEDPSWPQAVGTHHRLGCASGQRTLSCPPAPRPSQSVVPSERTRVRVPAASFALRCPERGRDDNPPATMAVGLRLAVLPVFRGTCHDRGMRWAPMYSMTHRELSPARGRQTAWSQDKSSTHTHCASMHALDSFVRGRRERMTRAHWHRAWPACNRETPRACASLSSDARPSSGGREGAFCASCPLLPSLG